MVGCPGDPSGPSMKSSSWLQLHLVLATPASTSPENFASLEISGWTGNVPLLLLTIWPKCWARWSLLLLSSTAKLHHHQGEIYVWNFRYTLLFIINFFSCKFSLFSILIAQLLRVISLNCYDGIGKIIIERMTQLKSHFSVIGDIFRLFSFPSHHNNSGIWFSTRE